MTEEIERKRPKAIIERKLKSCTVEIIGKRYAINPDTLKTISAFFHLQATFSIDSHKKYASWTLIKIIVPYHFTWMPSFAIKTKIYLTDGEITVPLNVTDAEQQNGIDFEITEPKRITPKEAQEFIENGAIVSELMEDDTLRGLAIAKFSRR